MALFDGLQTAAAARLSRQPKSTGIKPIDPALLAAREGFRKTITPNFPNVAPGGGIKQGVPPPPASLANSPEVNQAYRNLMNYQAQSDADKGELRRNYGVNIDVSHKNRDKSLLNSHTGLNENGLLNSGIALKRDTELNTNYDTVDNQMTNNLNKAIDDIGRHLQGLNQDYQDRQVEASAAETQRRADAAAAKLVTDNANAAQGSQIDQLMAALGLTPGAGAAPVPQDNPVWTPAPAASIALSKPVVKPKPKPASGSTGSLAQKRVGGPQ